jgi:hypothetical protein
VNTKCAFNVLNESLVSKSIYDRDIALVTGDESWEAVGCVDTSGVIDRINYFVYGTGELLYYNIVMVYTLISLSFRLVKIKSNLAESFA